MSPESVDEFVFVDLSEAETLETTVAFELSKSGVGLKGDMAARDAPPPPARWCLREPLRFDRAREREWG